LEDARNYAITGCVDIHIPGKNMKNQCEVTNFCLPKCLELALNRGIDKFTGKQLGYPTPDPRTFTTVEDIIDVYLKQVSFFAEKIVKINNIYQALFAEYMPRPLASGVLDGCIEKGKESAAWSYYSRQIFAILGPTNVVNSLVAIKKLVFEEKRITLGDLLDALKSNLEGKEELRSMLLGAPKYGNDNDYVDRLAAEVHGKTNEEIRKFTDLFGFKYIADGSGMSANFGLAVGTGATPDGRKDGEAYADGVLSPSIGSDIKGPTAVLKSASKVDSLSYSYLLNQKFLPQYLKGENREIFAQYLKGWYDLGISHVQFNVVNRETLIDAQSNPDEYRHLVVRVAGYSAYFADLSRDLQDLIIARTEQAF
jgi:choline trimethylamine-lyase